MSQDDQMRAAIQLEKEETRKADVITNIPAETFSVLTAVARERARQDRIFEEQNHDFGSWLAILQEELGEASREQMEKRYRGKDSGPDFRKELVEATAVLAAAIECGDRNGWFE